MCIFLNHVNLLPAAAQANSIDFVKVYSTGIRLSVQLT